ncbi:MAG TPA: pirin family protein [Gammaproteobacteria bacterium]|nr:pirin family protein [Gammaproteobacteria bacterium]
MNKVIHRAESRGLADHGWLRSRHTFSFAGYYDSQRMGFGKLRVINDDVVMGGGGFDTHPHENMEIISVPLSGALKHQDSMGNTHVIRHGEIQLMSAGTGITHSEYNYSDTHPVNFLQIWVQPREMDITPRYGQKAFPESGQHNNFQLLISPEKKSDTIWINQDAYFSLGDFDQGARIHYALHTPGNGIYVFVIDGEIELADERLASRDAIGLTDLDGADIRAVADSRILLIEVPMQ